MIYNFNLGIGWASSGVEYAQLYRARRFREIGAKAKFIFTDMFPKENIQHLTENIGLLDEEVEWLYTFFTDTGISPVTFTLSDLEKTFPEGKYTFSREGKIAKYVFEGEGNFMTVYLVKENKDLVHRVEIVSKGALIRKDYYTYCRIFSEYYAPLDHKAHLYQRRFYQKDGSTCYEEIIDEDRIMYRFPDRILLSKQELVGYMVERLHLTENDLVIIDRTTDIGQSILRRAKPAKTAVIVHADHFSESICNEDYLLWNNYYEYPFAQYKHVDYYITATDAQNRLMREQFKKYKNAEPNVVTIPVGSLSELTYPEGERRPYSLITASRLAAEKHVDWIIDAVLIAKKQLPELSLDIYGKGVEEGALKKKIEDNRAGEYIRLCGQQKLDLVYRNYEGYISGSTSEGFGLTLMEAVGSGLPIIGFDVRYGNPTFIDDKKCGYLIPVSEERDGKERSRLLAEKIVELFTKADLEAFHKRAYEKAEGFLAQKVADKWKELLEW